MPLSIGLSVLGAVTLTGGGLRLVHAFRQRSAMKQLKLFKGQVVELSDSLDALKERHKQLPFTDPDFKSPMTGETLALYQAAQEALGRYRERWLTLMDAWDRAQAEIEAEAPFGTRRLCAARKILAEAAVPDEMHAIGRECAEPLDRLEQAHEKAAALQVEIDKENNRLTEQLAKIQSANLSSLPYQADLETNRQSAAHVKSIVVCDPICAQTILTQSRDQLRTLNHRLEGVVQRFHESEEAFARLQAAADLATAQRAAGFLLREPGGDPDPLLSEGRDLQQHAIQDLNRGDAEAAGRDLKHAVSLAERADQAIKQQAQAKAYCETEIPARRNETRRLNEAARQARIHYEDLDKNFARENWRTVADNLTKAAGFLAAFDARVDDAAAATATDLQHFLRGAGLLKEIQEQQKGADLLLTAVDGRLKELVTLRERCRHSLVTRGGEPFRSGNCCGPIRRSAPVEPAISGCRPGSGRNGP